jgi:transcriptional regulator with XRE-family HTH domain
MGATETRDPRERLAERLRGLRGATGLSLKDLEGRTHASDSSLSRYLSGKSVPPWSVVVALCELADEDPSGVRRLWECARSPETVADPGVEVSAGGPGEDRPDGEAAPQPPREQPSPPPPPPAPRPARPATRRRRRYALCAALGLAAGLAAPPGVREAVHLYHEATYHRPPQNPLIHANPASGPAGRFDYVTDPYVRVKTQPGEFRMTLRNSPSGWLCVKLVDATTGRSLGRPECLSNGETKVLVPYVRAVTRFHVDGMSGGAGQYHGTMFY